jgi:hypothetical protein
LGYHWTLWEFHWKTFLWETTQQIEYFALFRWSYTRYISSPDPKGHVRYCHHLSSVR